jgi:hypothetical protein
MTLKEMWGYATILFVTTCDYLSFVTIFTTTYQLHQIWGGFATILWIMCNYCLLHPPMWMLLGLYSSINNPPWPICCTCNQNIVTNWCTMCIRGMICTHIWGCTIKKSIYTIIHIYYEYYQHICKAFNVIFLWKLN